MRICIWILILALFILVCYLVITVLDNKNLKLEVQIYRKYAEKYLNSKRYIPTVERFKDEILACKDSWMNACQIAKTMGLDSSTIYKAFKRRGVK